MKINKPKFWDKKIGLISILLIPLSIITQILIFIKKNFTNSRIFKIPIICIGNIYVGGTGKTPTAIFLTKELEQKGKKPVILRKYYNSHSDEHGLIKSKVKSLILSSNRLDGVNKALSLDHDMVILDDGLQDYNIKKNLSIVCFNENQLIGNGLVLPAGPLRESLNALKNAEIVLINGNKNKNFEEKILNINKNLDIFSSSFVNLS